VARDGHALPQRRPHLERHRTVGGISTRVSAEGRGSGSTLRPATRWTSDRSYKRSPVSPACRARSSCSF
jgi:hypothetical protein